MDILDQLIVQMERQLYQKLETSSDPEIRRLAIDLSHLKRSKEIVNQSAPLSVWEAVPASTNGNVRPGLTQGDAAIEIIQKAGRPLHVSEILREMPRYGINTVKQNLVSIILKDRRQRFERKGPNIFGVKEAMNGSGQAGGFQGSSLFAPAPSIRKERSRSKLPKDFSLIESIKALLPELKGEFSQPIIYAMLTKRYPAAAPNIQRASIATMLSKLLERGIIEVTHKGYGSDPRRYRRKERG